MRDFFVGSLKCTVATVLAFVLALSGLFASEVFAGGTPYQGYTYNFWSVLVPSPAAYIPVRAFNIADIDPALGLLNDPTDIHVCPYENILIVDSGNNRIIVFDSALNLIREIDGFYENGIWQTFRRPNGVFVTYNQDVFVADTLNERVVVMDWYGNFIRNITAPQGEEFADDFVFRPMSVLVDRGGRTYVIVQHVFEGIMSFNHMGDFVGYFGTITVNFNWIEVFWRFFMTDAQLARQSRFIPTEFQGMALDAYNFVFTTNIEPWANDNQVMRLNPRGEDVLQNFNDNVTISGDQRHRPSGAMSGPSAFIDIIARPNGMYSALDSTRGRVYTYDSEGNLLYVFSGIGTIQGMSRRPVAIEIIGEDILILDAGANRVIQFTPTEYGRLINLAVEMTYNGNEVAAVETWRELAAFDENFSLAWVGIGRGMLADGDSASAMYYLRRGMDMRHYSVAFRRYRLDRMQVILPATLTGGMIFAGLIVVYKLAKFIITKRGKAVTA